MTLRRCHPAVLNPPTQPTPSTLRPSLPQSPKEADARALLRLLSPTGPLFAAMYSADADGATQFFFPKERLPTHTQVRPGTAGGIVWQQEKKKNSAGCGRGSRCC